MGCGSSTTTVQTLDNPPEQNGHVKAPNSRRVHDSTISNISKDPQSKASTTAIAEDLAVIPATHPRIEESPDVNKPESRPVSADVGSKSGSRPASAGGGSKSGSRPASAEVGSKSGSRPASVRGGSKSGSRPVSGTSARSKPSSAQNRSRPSSAMSGTNSRPTSAQEEDRVPSWQSPRPDSASRSLPPSRPLSAAKSDVVNDNSEEKPDVSGHTGSHPFDGFVNDNNEDDLQLDEISEMDENSRNNTTLEDDKKPNETEGKTIIENETGESISISDSVKQLEAVHQEREESQLTLEEEVTPRSDEIEAVEGQVDSDIKEVDEGERDQFPEEPEDLEEVTTAASENETEMEKSDQEGTEDPENITEGIEDQGEKEEHEDDIVKKKKVPTATLR